MEAILYLIFLLSGAAGLFYESVWARYLGLFVGHSAYAQILVIAIFLGGMALGALLVGQRSTRLRDPLRSYALVELAVGAVGVFFHDLYGAATGFAYDALFPALAGTVGVTVAKWGIAGALILPQSVLLGATFPLMAAGVLRRLPQWPGRTLAILYFVNSLGAAMGVLVAGFYLLALAGLPGTLLAAGMLNLLVALVAFAVAARYPVGAPPGEPTAPPRIEGAGEELALLTREQLRRLLLGVSFGTAVASFIYEIAWLRMLALVLGSATHSFELMLSAFILGLALGSLWARTGADRWRNPLRALGIVQWVMGGAALLTLPLYAESFQWVYGLRQTYALTDAGYAGFTLARYGLCLLVMLPATFCAGITLPLITRTLLVGGAGERAIGTVYGVNALGSIVGVGLAGLILMPLIGVRLLLVSGATLDMALGIVLLLAAVGRHRLGRPFAYGAAAAGGLVLAATAATVDFDERVLSSGVFRAGATPDPTIREVLYYRDGRTATVSAWRAVADSTVAITTNGKVDGSASQHWLTACTDSTRRRPLDGDMSTQSLAPLITLAHNPRARTTAVVGHGTGMSSHFLLGSPAVERVVTIEIEPEMVRASRVFYPANRRVFDDPRSTIVIEDARTYLAATPERYDLIFSEPSNPWVSGVASLFTTEFYRHVRGSLSPDGVFGQWIHLYELHDGLVLSVLAAIHEHFPDYELFLTHGRDLLIVAGAGERLAVPDWSIFSFPGVAADFCHVIPPTPHFLEAARLLSRAALAPLLDDWGHPNSDFHPVLDLGAERARYLNQFAYGFGELPLERTHVAAPFFGRLLAPGTDAAVPMAGIPRVQAVALAAALRAPQATRALDSAALPLGLDAARYRAQRWAEGLDTGRPPPDWREWLADLRVVEGDRHQGTAGFVDAAFYGDVERFLERHRARDEVRQVVAFYRGLAAWDFAAAARAADALLERVVEGEGWLPPDEYLDGAVTAKLALGDVAGAAEIRKRVASLRRRPPGDLRSRLLDAYLEAVAGAAGAYGGVPRR